MGLEAQIQAAVDLAFEEIGDLAADVCVTRQAQGSFDVATGDATEVEVEYFFEGVIDENAKLGAGESGVGTSMVKLYLKPGDTVPERGDVARIGDARHRIERVKAVRPNGVTTLLWELDVSV